MSKTNLTKSLDNLHLSDVYSLMLFVLYKMQEIPDYATLSELCYLLDGSNLNRLLTYFAGQTITFPTREELSLVTNALLLYQYTQVDGLTFDDAHNKLLDLTAAQHRKVTDIYLKILPIMADYNIDRSQVQKNDR